MSSRNERFNSSIRSIDWVEESGDSSKDPRQSDGGLGVSRMINAIDFDWTREVSEWSREIGQRNASTVGAILRLEWSGKHHLIAPLLAIFENGSDIASSLLKIKKSTYFWARNALLKFFIGL